MIIISAAKRLADSRKSTAGKSSTRKSTTSKSRAGILTTAKSIAQAVEPASRATNLTGQPPSEPDFSWVDELENNIWQHQKEFKQGYTASGSGWSLLAPLTAGFIVRAVGHPSRRKKSADLLEIANQIDQYKFLKDKLPKSQNTLPPKTTNLPEPEAPAKKPENNSLHGGFLGLWAPPRRTFKNQPVKLPQRPFIPAPIRSGKIFREPENADNPHKMFKSGWIKLKNRR